MTPLRQGGFAVLVGFSQELWSFRSCLRVWAVEGLQSFRFKDEKVSWQTKTAVADDDDLCIHSEGWEEGKAFLAISHRLSCMPSASTRHIKRFGARLPAASVSTRFKSFESMPQPKIEKTTHEAHSDSYLKAPGSGRG